MTNKVHAVTKICVLYDVTQPSPDNTGSSEALICNLITEIRFQGKVCTLLILPTSTGDTRFLWNVVKLLPLRDKTGPSETSYISTLLYADDGGSCFIRNFLHVYRRINKITLQMAAFFRSLWWEPQISFKNVLMASETNSVNFVTGPSSLVLLLLPVHCRCRGLWLYLITLNVTDAR